MFPTTPGNRYAMTISYPANTSLPTGGGFEASLRSFGRPRYSFALGWVYKQRSDAEAFRDHVIQQTAGVLSFPFITWLPMWHRFAQVGIGDGSTVQFDFPGVGTSDQQLLIRGSLIGANVTHRGFPNADLVTLFSPPDLYEPISASFFGKRIHTVVYANDGEPRIAKDLETETYMVNVTLATDRANGVRQ